MTEPTRSDELRALAAKLSRDAFTAQFAHLFLLYVPRTSLSESPDDDIAFRTAHVEAGAHNADFLPSERIVFDVRKRSTNPFRDRISVGRAPNCDVVARFPFVSKLHAHFVTHESGAIAISDQRSANGTFINGAPLEPGRVATLKLGDWVRFGLLGLELVDAATLHARLRDGLRDAR